MRKITLFILMGLIVAAAQAAPVTLIDAVEANWETDGNGCFFNDAGVRTPNWGDNVLEGSITGWKMTISGSHSAFEVYDYYSAWNYETPGGTDPNATSSKWVCNGMAGAIGIIASDPLTNFPLDTVGDKTTAIALSVQAFARDTGTTTYDWEIAVATEAEATTMGAGTVLGSGSFSFSADSAGDLGESNYAEVGVVDAVVAVPAEAPRLRIKCSGSSQAVTDHVLLTADDDLGVIKTYVDLSAYTGGNAILGKGAAEGNGNFSEIDPWTAGTKPEEAPRQIFVTSQVNNSTLSEDDPQRTATIKDWELYSTYTSWNQVCGWVSRSDQPPYENPAGGFHPDAGSYTLAINTRSGVRLTSKSNRPISGQVVGDTYVIEFMYSAQSGKVYDNCDGYLIFDQGLPTEKTVYAGSFKLDNSDRVDAANPDYKRIRLFYPVTTDDLAATTIDMQIEFSNTSGSASQLWLSNFEIRDYPVYYIGEDAPTNEALLGYELDAAPIADANIPLILSSANEADIYKGDLDVEELIFTSANWDISQPATFTAVGNDVIDGDKIFYVAADSSDPNDPNAVPGFVAIVVIDDEYPAFTAPGLDGLILGEGDIPDVSNSVMMTLTGLAAADVDIVFVDSSGLLELVTPVTFTVADITNGVAKELVFGAIDNETVDSTSVFTEDFRIDVSSADAAYQTAFNGLPLRVHDATILEDDCGASDVVYHSADANKDCKVDLLDFAELSADWLTETFPNVDSGDVF